MNRFLFLTIAALLALDAAGQKFEVVSVKPFQRAGGGFQGVLPSCKGGRFAAIAPLLVTLQWAYDLQTAEQTREMRTKLPSWTETPDGFYALEATTGPNVTGQECKLMAQKLFEDRFQFRYHWETVRGDVYELVVAKGGFKMQPADPDSPAANVNVVINGNPQTFPPDSIAWTGTTMDELAQRLTNNARRLPVIDKTGVEGRFKYKIAYSTGAETDREFADPDLFTALEQQLGLKLQEAKGPVRHFVVDGMERPDVN